MGYPPALAPTDRQCAHGRFDQDTLTAPRHIGPVHRSWVAKSSGRSRPIPPRPAAGGPPGRLARYEANARVLIDGLAQMGFKMYLERVSPREPTRRPSHHPPHTPAHTLPPATPTRHYTRHPRCPRYDRYDRYTRRPRYDRIVTPVAPVTPVHPLHSQGLEGAIISTFVCPDDPSFNFDTFYEDLASRGLVIYPGKLTQVSCVPYVHRSWGIGAAATHGRVAGGVASFCLLSSSHQ